MNGGTDIKKEELSTDLVLNIMNASNLLQRVSNNLAKQAGLSSIQQYLILKIVSYKGTMPLHELQQHLHITKQGLTGVIQRLIQSGYLNSHTDAKDRRRTIISLTDKGQKCIKAIHPVRVEEHKKMYACLTDQELIEMNSSIKKLADHLIKTYE